MVRIEKLKYNDYWFNYCTDTDPNEIKSTIHEEYIISHKKKIHLDIFGYTNEDLTSSIIFVHGTSVYSRFYAEFLYHLYKPVKRKFNG